MAEPIDMPFGLWTWVGPRKYSIRPMSHMQFCRASLARVKVA